MIEDLTPKAIETLGLIERAARVGAPLTRVTVRERLGYRSRGAANRLVDALIKEGAVRLDSRAHPAALIPVERVKEVA